MNKALGADKLFECLVMCVRFALIFVKSGGGITEGGFLRNLAASSKVMS
jgi:hypothetical protein